MTDINKTWTDMLIKYVTIYQDKISFFDLSSHPSITYDIYLATKDIVPWNVKAMIRNPNITLDMWLNIIMYDTTCEKEKCNVDIITRISQYAHMQDIYKYSKVISYDFDDLSYNKNITLDFIKENMNKNWNWQSLSSNKNITLDFIKENIHENWNWYRFSGNKNITFDFIKDNIDKDWNFDMLLFKGILDIDSILSFINICNSERLYDAIKSKSSYITEDIFINYPKVSWDMHRLSGNKNISIHFIIENYNKYRWDWDTVTSRGDVTIKLLSEYSYLPWSWYFLSSKSDININFILTYSDYQYNWATITSHPNIMIDDIINHTHLPWETDSIVHNPNLQFSDISKLIDNNIIDHTKLKLISKLISEHCPNIKINHLIDHPEVGLSWEYFSSNKSVTQDIIIEHIDQPWHWENILCCTPDYVKANLQRNWDFYYYTDKMDFETILNNKRNWAHYKIINQLEMYKLNYVIKHN